MALHFWPYYSRAIYYEICGCEDGAVEAHEVGERARGRAIGRERVADERDLGVWEVGGEVRAEFPVF